MRFGIWVCWVYLERESVIPGAILWRSEVSGSVEVLPDGCMDILSVDGELVLAGSDTSVARVECPEPTRFLGVRFLPGTLPSKLPVNPKDVLNSRVHLSEVLTRFQSAVGRLPSGMSLAAVAAACGYSDQSHMTRDFQALGGASPHTLRARRLTAMTKDVRNVQAG
jgi:AraC-like DNA-binding protein